MSRKKANAFSHQPGRQDGYVSGLTSFSDNVERGSAPRQNRPDARNHMVSLVVSVQTIHVFYGRR